MADRRLCTLLAGLSLAALVAGGAQAQNAGVDRRLDRIERDLKTIQSIVLQAQATGQPVVVRPQGPDPALTAMQGRIDDLEATLQRINGQIETLAHDIAQIRRDGSAADQDRASQMTMLSERMARLESALNAYTGAASASDPALSDATPPPEGDPAADATARAQAGDRGVLGGPSSAPARPATPAAAFAAARDLYTSGRPAAAADALQGFISANPKDRRTPEAYYWLGESFYAQKGYQNATAAYASALRDRPDTTWAAAAMVRLSQSLLQSNQDAQACAALSEFDRRYAAKASGNLKSNADAVRRRANCG